MINDALQSAANKRVGTHEITTTFTVFENCVFVGPLVPMSIDRHIHWVSQHWLDALLDVELGPS